MTSTILPRELYLTVHAYTGSELFGEVLAAWIDTNATAVREMLAPLGVHGRWRRVEYSWGDLLEQAYALSRANDLLLLGFQPGLPDGAETPWAHRLHLPGGDVGISEYEYVSVFSALGMRRAEVPGLIRSSTRSWPSSRPRTLIRRSRSLVSCGRA